MADCEGEGQLSGSHALRAMSPSPRQGALLSLPSAAANRRQKQLSDSYDHLPQAFFGGRGCVSVGISPSSVPTHMADEG